MATKTPVAAAVEKKMIMRKIIEIYSARVWEAFDPLASAIYLVVRACVRACSSACLPAGLPDLN